MKELLGAIFEFHYILVDTYRVTRYQVKVNFFQKSLIDPSFITVRIYEETTQHAHN
jgi:hypothetical protein